MACSTQRKTGRPVADLIAVSCILLVVGILVHPILARSRANPRCTCQSNLKQLCKALSVYVNDYDATLPSSILYGNSKTWDPEDFVRFAKEQGSLSPPRGAHRQSWPMVLSSYLSDYRCLWCPSDRSRSSSPAARISYYWKAAVDRAWYGDPSVGRFQRDGAFVFPGDQIVFYERNGWHRRRSSRGLADGAVINCAFLDGHVGSLQVRDSGYTRREKPAEPLPASGVGEPAWFNYSIGDDDPRFHRGQNWNPTLWADRMRELPSKCDDPAATCQDNLRRLATVVLIYANDWDEAMPSSYLYGRSDTWNTDDFVRFACERGKFPPPEGGAQLSWPMVFYFHLGRSDRALWCPSDAGRSRDPSARVSYYWKAAVDAAWYGGPDGAGPEARYLNDYMFPADQVVFYERNGWHKGRGRGLADGAIINCAFMDGHVSSKMIQDSGYCRGERPAGPLPSSGVGEPAWFNYSFGAETPERNKGGNWDPTIWGDALR